MPSQLPLPLEIRAAFTRADFVPSLASAPALAFIDSWPNWLASSAVLFGPGGSGKTHLVSAWSAASRAQIVPAAALSGSVARLDPSLPVAVEDVDSADVNPARDSAIFSLLERATKDAPVLLTGHAPPAQWKATLPDLSSRFSALLAFSLWAPDDELLFAIARKLFADRQLAVPDTVIQKMVTSLERSPAAMRDFVARADAKALAEGRAVNLALVREMLALP